MKKINVLHTCTMMLVLLGVSTVALATVSVPDSGNCTSLADGTTCFAITYVPSSGNGEPTPAIFGGTSTANGGVGVWGSSNASGNTGFGVYGVSDANNLGVGVKGLAGAGSTAIWGYDLQTTGVAGWFDGRLVVASADFEVHTAGKGIVLKNGTLCQRVSLHSGGGSLDFTTVTCP
jgi:hypothetical protein